MNQTAISLANTTVETVRNENTKVLRVTDFFVQPDAILESAAKHSFMNVNSLFPGLRAAMEPALLDPICTAVSQLASTYLGHPETTWKGQAWYSIVSEAPEKLRPLQRLPHFDGFDEDQLAIMIYLNKTEHGGTAFFRHKSTGFERVSEGRFPEYRNQLESAVASNGMPPARYVTDGAPRFEKIADFGAQFNSLVLYPSTLLHSGVIDNDLPLPRDPMTGRFTLNGFFKPG